MHFSSDRCVGAGWREVGACVSVRTLKLIGLMYVYKKSNYFYFIGIAYREIRNLLKYRNDLNFGRKMVLPVITFGREKL